MPPLDPKEILEPVVAELQAEVPALIQTLPGLQALLQAQAREAFIRANIDRLFNESAVENDQNRREALGREVERLGREDLPQALAAVEQAKAEIQAQLNRELGTRLVMKARAALLAAGLSEAETAAAMGDFYA